MQTYDTAVVGAERFCRIEKSLETSTSEARAKRGHGFGVSFGNETDEGGGELAEVVGYEKIRRGGAEVAANNAGEYWCDKFGDVRVEVETPIVEHGGGELHHMGENKERFEVVGHFFGDELHKIRN